jgi:hypothetical protein
MAETLTEQGFNQFNRRESVLLVADNVLNRNEPASIQVPLSEVSQIIPDRSLGRESSEGLLIYDNGVLRFAAGYLSSGVYGIKGWDVTGNSIFELSGSNQQVAGWNFTNTVLRSGATDAASNVLIDAANSLIRLGPTTGNYITLDGANLRIRSSNYVAGVSGCTWEPTLVEAENLVARGILRGATFAYNVVSAVGGQLVVSNADTLASDMTALDASTLTTRGTTTWAVNDMLLIQATTGAGIQTEYLRITDISAAPTYTVTRDLAAAYAANSNPVWQQGTTITKIGVSDGAASWSGGWLRLIGEGTNSPFYSVFSRTGVLYGDYAERVRLGNLNGWQSAFSADAFGIAIGNYSTGKYLTYDDVTGNLVVNGYIQSSKGAFGGDGSDGALAVTSGTTTIDLGGAQVVTKQYSSISITGTGKVAFSNPHASGTTIVLKSKGDITITSSTAPCLDASGMGAAAITNGGNIFDDSNHYGVAGNTGSDGVTSTGGAGAAAVNGNVILGNKKIYAKSTNALLWRGLWITPGSGGNTGGTGGKSALNGGWQSLGGAGGAGGRGGAALLIECGGAWNYTVAGGISVAGAAGSDGSVGGSGTWGVNAQGGGGGGGGGSGGAGGMLVALYNTLTANSGTVNTSGGAGGNGGDGGTSSGVVAQTAGGGSGSGAAGPGGYAAAGANGTAGVAGGDDGANGANGNNGVAGTNDSGSSGGSGGGGGGGNTAFPGGIGGTGGTGGVAGTSDNVLVALNTYFA